LSDFHPLQSPKKKPNDESWMKCAFKGNKQHLPSKPCKACGREMSWRKAWAKNWEHVLYCSVACRKNKMIR